MWAAYGSRGNRRDQQKGQHEPGNNVHLSLPCRPYCPSLALIRICTCTFTSTCSCLPSLGTASPMVVMMVMMTFHPYSALKGLVHHAVLCVWGGEWGAKSLSYRYNTLHGVCHRPCYLDQHVPHIHAGAYEARADYMKPSFDRVRWWQRSSPGRRRCRVHMSLHV